jgi:hypothetical protein
VPGAARYAETGSGTSGLRFPGEVTMIRVAALTLALLLAAPGSETPPKGPPWVREFGVAQEQALKQGKPIFVYLTKTH